MALTTEERGPRLTLEELKQAAAEMRARVVLERDPFLVLAIVCFTGSSVFPN